MQVDVVRGVAPAQRCADEAHREHPSMRRQSNTSNLPLTYITNTINISTKTTIRRLCKTLLLVMSGNWWLTIVGDSQFGIRRCKREGIKLGTIVIISNILKAVEVMSLAMIIE